MRLDEVPARTGIAIADAVIAAATTRFNRFVPREAALARAFVIGDEMAALQTGGAGNIFHPLRAALGPVFVHFRPTHAMTLRQPQIAQYSL